MAELIRKEQQPEGFVIYTDYQLGGKGQRGNIWSSENGKNILMSVLLRPRRLDMQDQYLLNIIAALAVLDLLGTIISPGKEVKVKWPNDVFVEGKKICGILVENSVRGKSLESSIVGIGLNVNQQGFNQARATSLFLETGSNYDREFIMEVLLSRFEKWYLKLNSGQKDEIVDRYHENLLWKGELRTYKANGEDFVGTIKGINGSGQLMIDRESGERNVYNVKEVSFQH
ncbi:MAG: biotin--[acetyl-CoA-carboxylase] ligase [Ekhidna sp.]